MGTWCCGLTVTFTALEPSRDFDLIVWKVAASEEGRSVHSRNSMPFYTRSSLLLAGLSMVLAPGVRLNATEQSGANVVVTQDGAGVVTLAASNAITHGT